MVEVERYMSRGVVGLSSRDSIQSARNLMLKEGASRVLVFEGEKPVGMVTKKDIARRLAQPRAPWQRRPIDSITLSRIMSTGLKTLPPDSQLQEAARLMDRENISSIPVVRGGDLLGILTLTDLTRAFTENFEGDFKVGELMNRGVITANRNHSLYHIVELMKEKDIRRVVITEAERPVGIVTVTDLSFLELSDPELGIKMKEIMYVRKPGRSQRASQRYILHSPLTAEDVMSREILTTEEEEDAARAAKIMLEKEISSLPVVKDGKFVGIITKKDIMRGLSRK